MKKQFAIIGLGAFGEAIALELMRLGHDVLGVDINEEKANRIADNVTQAVIADATDEEALKELDLQRFDAVAIAIGEDIEASVLCTMLVKSLEAKEVWVKAISDIHHRIVQKLGADRILQPEKEIGVHVAQSLAHPNMLDYISLGDDYFLIEIRPGSNLEERTISELGIDEEKIHLLAVKHGQELILTPGPEQLLRRNDHLVLVGDEQALRHFAEDIEGI